jgi:hypothetical protein
MVFICVNPSIDPLWCTKQSIQRAAAHGALDLPLMASSNKVMRNDETKVTWNLR